MNEPNKTLPNGFTLVELSIVLVIIGLIVSGVVGGQSLIQSAKINSLVSDIAKYQIAITTFEMQHNAKPGDMTDATEYWPSCTDDGVNTCNGDGNGVVEIFDGTDWIGENFRAWQHLSLAKILPNEYTGISGPSGNGFQIGINTAPSKIDGIGFEYRVPQPPGNDWLGRTGHFFKIGGEATTSLNGAILRAKDAKAIDVKMDDGKPDTGVIMPFNGENFARTVTYTCLTAANNVTPTDYVLNSSEIACALFFFLD